MDLLLPLLIALQPTATPVQPAPLTCPPAVIGREESSGAELRVALQQYSSIYGPYLVLQLNRSPAQFQTQIVRIGDRHLGDGRPITAGANSGFPDGGWQLLYVRRHGVAALGTAADVRLVDRGGTVITIAADRQAVSAFAACLESLPVGTNETPSDVSAGWHFIILPPNRPVSHGSRPTVTYPVTALREEREGDTMVQVVVQPNGMASNCTIASSSGSPDLDLAACEATQRMRFRVATDDKGEPIAASVRIPFSWRIG